MLVYSADKLYDHDNSDEVRRSWNDSIIPESINDKTEGLSVGKPWNCLAFPHK